jgi:hypothetical protein
MGITDLVVENEVAEILSQMATDFRLRTAVQPVGYALVKAFRVET